MSARRSLRIGVFLATGVIAWFSFRAWSKVPLGPDAPALNQFAPALPPGPAVEVTPLELGSALAPKCAAAGDASCLAPSTIAHAAYLVRAPRATFLIDSGLHKNAKDDLSRFPLPVHIAFNFDQQRGLGEALANAGNPKLDFVLLTHAHWDHTSGLVDLDHPKVVVGPGEEEFVKDFPRDGMPFVMADHLKNATMTTFKWDGPPVENFPASHDLLGDGSVILVPLPGHTPGSIGVLLGNVHGKRLLFVGDAAWSNDAVEIPSVKLKPMAELADKDWPRESETVWRLHHLAAHDPSLIIVPAHDAKALERVAALGGAK